MGSENVKKGSIPGKFPTTRLPGYKVRCSLFLVVINDLKIRNSTLNFRDDTTINETKP